MAASVITVASAAAVPSALNSAKRRRSEPISSERPMIPLQVIITAANTVSRASASVSASPETISVTIRPTSITVTATARVTDPRGYDLRVVNRGKHRGDEEDRGDREHEGGRLAGPGRCQDDQGEHRDGEAPVHPLDQTVDHAAPGRAVPSGAPLRRRGRSGAPRRSP